MQRRLPKRGFTNIFRKEYVIVKLGSLNDIPESTITPELLLEKRLIRDYRDGVKILGEGEIKKPLTVKAHAFSASAKEKIVNAGGSAEVIKAKVLNK